MIYLRWMLKSPLNNRLIICCSNFFFFKKRWYYFCNYLRNGLNMVRNHARQIPLSVFSECFYCTSCHMTVGLVSCFEGRWFYSSCSYAAYICTCVFITSSDVLMPRRPLGSHMSVSSFVHRFVQKSQLKVNRWNTHTTQLSIELQHRLISNQVLQAATLRSLDIYSPSALLQHLSITVPDVYRKTPAKQAGIRRISWGGGGGLNTPNGHQTAKRAQKPQHLHIIYKELQCSNRPLWLFRSSAIRNAFKENGPTNILTYGFSFLHFLLV